MHGYGDMALNESFSNDFGWYCYNVTIGDPTTSGNVVDSISSSDTVWSYENSSKQPFTTTVAETWTDTETASVSVSQSATVSLGVNVDIPDVGGSSFSITISTESTDTETKESSYSLSQNWSITIDAGEDVRIERTKTVTSGRADYLLKYGLYYPSWIGTAGDQWDGHYYWSYEINGLLGSPQGTMVFSGLSQKTSFLFTIIRTGPDGIPRSSPLPKPTFAMKHVLGEKGATKIEYAKPGITDTPYTRAA